MATPHWHGCLSRGHTVTAGQEVRTGLQTLFGELQAHETELDLTAKTDDVLAARFVMLCLLAAGGTGPYGGALIHPLNLREGGGLAVLEELEVLVNAALVVAAVRAGGPAFPRLHTLPAEVEGFLVVHCADCAQNIEVV